MCGCARAIPAETPVIKPNYLSTDEDRRIAAQRHPADARRSSAQPALAPYHPAEYLPGAAVRDDDEPALVKAAGDIGTTIFHPVGTAKMGLASDPLDGGRRAPARDRRRAAARHRRLGHADHHVRQYQRADHDDRRKGRRDDPRRRQGAWLMNAIAARGERSSSIRPPAGRGSRRNRAMPSTCSAAMWRYSLLIPALAGLRRREPHRRRSCREAASVRAPILDGLFGAVLRLRGSLRPSPCSCGLLIDRAGAPVFGGRRSFERRAQARGLFVHAGVARRNFFAAAGACAF